MKPFAICSTWEMIIAIIFSMQQDFITSMKLHKIAYHSKMKS